MRARPPSRPIPVRIVSAAIGLSMAGLAALLPPAAQAQSPARECGPASLLGTGAGQSGTVVICSTPLRADPAFKALVAQLNELSQRNAELSGAVQKLAPALNGATQSLTNAQLSALAANLSKRLPAAGAQADARTTREIERLRLSLEDVKDKLDAAMSDPARRAEARAQMGGAAGDAIARLDFAAAQKLLDELGTIKEQTLSACAKDPRLFAITKGEAAQAMAGMQALQAPTRCAKGWATVLAFHEAAVAAEAKGDLNAACTSYQEFTGRATQVRGELTSAQVTEQVRRQSAQQHQGQMAMIYDTQHDRVVRVNRVMAMRFANSDKLRRELAQAHETLARAESLAAQGNAEQAVDVLIDASNMYRSIEYEGGRYNQPFQPTPKHSFNRLVDLQQQARQNAAQMGETLRDSGLTVCQ